MSAEHDFISFIEELPEQEQIMILLVDSFRTTYLKYSTASEPTKDLILPKLKMTFKYVLDKMRDDIPVYKDNTNAEKSTSKPAVERPKPAEKSTSKRPKFIDAPDPLAKLDIKLDEKLGDWGSSFSNDSDSDDARSNKANDADSDREELVQDSGSITALPLPPLRTTSLSSNHYLEQAIIKPVFGFQDISS